MHKKKAKKRNEGLEEERKIAKQKAFNALRLPSRSPLLDGAKWVEREEAKKSLARAAFCMGEQIFDMWGLAGRAADFFLLVRDVL